MTVVQFSKKQGQGGGGSDEWTAKLKIAGLEFWQRDKQNDILKTLRDAVRTSEVAPDAFDQIFEGVYRVTYGVHSRPPLVLSGTFPVFEYTIDTNTLQLMYLYVASAGNKTLGVGLTAERDHALALSRARAWISRCQNREAHGNPRIVRGSFPKGLFR